LKEMEHKGLKPRVVTYNVLMTGFCRLGRMKNAGMLLNAMLNIGVSLDDITYNIL
jgi:pentatricopeptide repeat protein